VFRRAWLSLLIDFLGDSHSPGRVQSREEVLMSLGCLHLHCVGLVAIAVLVLLSLSPVYLVASLVQLLVIAYADGCRVFH